MTDQLRRNASLAEALGGALRDGGHALGAVPALLKQVLAEEAWREFVTQRGEHIVHERIEDYVTTPPLKGLGASMDLVERVIGTDDPDLLRLWHNARKRRPGRPKKGQEKPGDSPLISDDQTGKAVERLARVAPDEYEAVRRGEKSIHAAAVAAGIRPRRVPVRLDRVESIAATLRKYLTPEQLSTLARLLQDGGD